MTSRTRFSLICLILAIELLAVTPLLANHVLTPRDNFKEYLMFTVGTDQLIYENHLLQASEGVTAFRDRMTTEPQPIGIVNIFWLTLGKFGALFRLTPLVTFTLARLALLPVLILTIFFLAKKTFSDDAEAFQATLFTAALSGIGYLFATPAAQPIDFLIQISTVPNLIFASPHYVAGTAMLVMIHWCFFRWSVTKSHRMLFLAGATGATLLAFQPYFFAIILVVPALWLFYRRRDLTRTDIIPLALFFGAIALPISYYALVTLLDPFTSARYEPNNVMTAGFLHDALSLSPVLFFAWLGFRKHQRETLWQYLTLWSVTALVMSHMPISNNHRYIQSAFIPLGFAAFVGFGEALAITQHRYGTGSKRFLAIRALAVWCLFSGTLLTVIAHNAVQKNFSFPPGFNEVMTRFESLPPGVVLSDPNLAIFVAGRTHQRAYVAHWSDTIDYDKKTALAESLFFETRDPAEIVQKLRRLGIRYLLVPTGSVLNPNALTELVRNDDFALFEVPTSSSL